jgi:hypothetical protein
VSNYGSHLLDRESVLDEICDLLCTAEAAAWKNRKSTEFADFFIRVDNALTSLLIDDVLAITLRPLLMEFFRLLREGHVPRKDRRYLREFSTARLAPILLEAGTESGVVFRICHLLEPAPTGRKSGIVTLLKAGELIERWKQLDPYLVVVRPAVASAVEREGQGWGGQYYDSGEVFDSSPGRRTKKKYAREALASIDHVLRLLDRAT